MQIAKGKERFSKYCIVAFVGKFSAIVYCIRVCTNVGNLFIFWADTDPIRVSPFLMTLVSFPNLAVLIQIPVIPVLGGFGFLPGIPNLVVLFLQYTVYLNISGYTDFDDFGSVFGYSQFGGFGSTTVFPVILILMTLVPF